MVVKMFIFQILNKTERNGMESNRYRNQMKRKHQDIPDLCRLIYLHYTYIVRLFDGML